MSALSALASWTVKRKRLLAGLVGCAVKGVSACVPGVGLAAELIGSLVEKTTEDLLDPETKQPLSREQIEQIEGWLQSLAQSYSGLLDRLEQLNLPDSGTLANLSATLAQTLAAHRDLLGAFDNCTAQVRKQTFSLGVIERKLDEHFHGQQHIVASLEEIKGLLIRSPLLGEWAELRRARPEAVRAVIEADEHFLAGREDQGIAVLLGLLRQRGVGEATLAHQVGLLELSRGRVREAREQLRQATKIATAAEVAVSLPALGATVATLATLSGRNSAGSVWRSLPRGFRVGRKYRVLEEVGRGGMASVYRAEKVASFEREREVALKVPAPELMRDPQTRQRFEQEIDVSRRLSAPAHPHIVKVMEYEIFDDPFTHQELYALVMEFVSGVNLARWLAHRRQSGKPVRLGEVRTLMQGVCAALEHAHAQGVFHRDLKPHNVMVAKGPVVKLMDFGIARVLEDGRDQLTRSGQVVGTPAYLPPELLGMQPVVDARTDVYLAGNLLLELLTGDPAGDAESRADCPAAWVDLIADSMNRVRSKRPVSMAAFRERLLAETAPTSPSPVPADPHKPIPFANEQPIPLDDERVRTPSAAAPTTRKPVPSMRERMEAALTGARPIPVAPSTVSKATPDLPREVVNSIGIKLVRILPGKFLMGSPTNEADRSSDEQQHEVAITWAFWLGIHPVTVGQFRAFVQATGYCTQAEREGGAIGLISGWVSSHLADAQANWQNPGFRQDDSHPVVCVSWNDAQEFCAWLTKSEPGRSYRLPTEAEWEYACRGGAPALYPFHIGRPLTALSSTLANFDGNHPYGRAAEGPYLERTTPVGSYQANAWGLFDMHGNVWEWCRDWYEGDDYQHSPYADLPGPSEGSVRVIRGGSWRTFGESCRSASRNRYLPGVGSRSLGFRVSLVLSSEQGGQA
jgi:formylglycine-generating enzyme required for sulfatase activity